MKNCGCLNKLADGGSVQDPYLTPLGSALRDIPAVLRAKMSADSAGQDTDEYDARLSQAINSGRFRPVTGGRRDPELNASANVSPLQVARGWLAGLAGIPGDVESLGRLVNNLMTPKGSGYREMDPHPVMPTSEFYQEWLPGRSDSAAGRTLSELGGLAGGLGATKVARGVQNVAAPVAKRTLATIDAGMRGQGPLRNLVAASAPAYAMKPRGGNWSPIPDDTLGGWIPENVKPGDNPVHDWSMKNLRNYITRDLGTATDPMLDVEREYPNMHFGDEGPGVSQGEVAQLYAMRNGMSGKTAQDSVTPYLNKHDELSGGAPLTRWGRLSDSQIIPSTAGEDFAREWGARWPKSSLAPDRPYADEPDPIGRLFEHTDNILSRGGGAAGARTPFMSKISEYRDQLAAARDTDWRAKKPDAPIYSLMSTARGDLGLGHIIDYLEAATEGHRNVASYGTADKLRAMLAGMGPGPRPAMVPEWQRALQLHDAGLTLDPNSLSRLSVPDAARKAIQWNRMLSEAAVAEDAPLQKGWKVHKDYGTEGNGMRWVEFGKPDTAALPEGWSRNAETGDIFDAAGKDVLDHPALTDLREGLSAEGDAMGHCVGGYCDDVLRNGTKIYSLRDAKGRPHVTIETRPDKGAIARMLNEIDDPDYVPRGQFDPKTQKLHSRVQSERSGNGDYEEYGRGLLQRLGYSIPDQIVQIKGKGNAAPVADYLPHVQDFVKSGKWGRVGDLRNTGLIKLEHDFSFKRPRGDYGTVKPGFYTKAELEKALVEQGLDPDAARIMAEGQGGSRYAHGGSVKADPNADGPGFLPRNIEETVDYLERLYALTAELDA